jgi:protein-S-isoprenylcysteine O-methyltransferase Ste14
MVTSHIVLGLGWILFCALHSIFAASKFKQIAERRMGRHYKFFRLYYTVFSFLSLAAIMILLFKMPSYQLFRSTAITIIIGSILVAFGGGIMCMCIIKYFMQLSGLKELFENRTSSGLMITGIHKIVRHPLYAGTFIFIWGLLILYPYLSLLISDVVITIYTRIGLRFEERKLEKEFGEKYAQYKKQVPMLVPKWR